MWIQRKRSNAIMIKFLIIQSPFLIIPPNPNVFPLNYFINLNAQKKNKCNSKFAF